MTITEKKQTDQDGPKSGIRLSSWLLGLCLILWTFIIAGVFAADVWHIRDTALQLAKAEARVHLSKDLAIRSWAASHGGVYVPRTEKTPQNPFLEHVTERDILTPSGKALRTSNPPASGI